jgi:hypothetical protein
MSKENLSIVVCLVSIILLGISLMIDRLDDKNIQQSKQIDSLSTRLRDVEQSQKILFALDSSYIKFKVQELPLWNQKVKRKFNQKK